MPIFCLSGWHFRPLGPEPPDHPPLTRGRSTATAGKKENSQGAGENWELGVEA